MKTKWFTETIAVDIETGESIPIYKLKNEYHEINRDTKSKQKNDQQFVKTIVIKCRKNDAQQRTFDWFN
nr:MAG: hypothetical protein [Microviridae sp.]